MSNLNMYVLCLSKYHMPRGQTQPSTLIQNLHTPYKPLCQKTLEEEIRENFAGNSQLSNMEQVWTDIGENVN